MKIECEVCEKVEAEVLCCADEAVLCRGCDEKVHAANKLSQKHQRLLLLNNPSSTSSSSHAQLPPCDICQVYIYASIIPNIILMFSLSLRKIRVNFL